MHPLFAGILSVYLCFAGLKMIMAAYNNDHTRQQKTCDPLPYTLFPLVLITLSLFHYPHYFSARPVLDKLPTCLAAIIAIFPFLTLPVCFPHRLALPSIVWTVLMRRNSTERRKLERHWELSRGSTQDMKGQRQYLSCITQLNNIILWRGHDLQTVGWGKINS